MRLPFIILFFFFINFNEVYTQNIVDQDFTWVKNNSCLAVENAETIFKKVEEDPIVTQYNFGDFEQLIEKSLQKMKLDPNQNGVLKLKILFPYSQNPCLMELGLQNITVSDTQLIELAGDIGKIAHFKPGKQRNQEVNSLGILYLVVENGALAKMRNINFNFQ